MQFPQCSLIVFQLCTKLIASNSLIDNLIPENYSSITAKPIKITWITIPYIIPSISVKDMEFTIDIEIRVHWFDTRLKIGENDAAIIPKDIAEQLWYPWINFENCKGCTEAVVNYNKQNFEVYQNGIYVVQRNCFKFSCNFDLRYYPFDQQLCDMQVRLQKWNGPSELNQTLDTEKYHTIYKHELTIPSNYKLMDINLMTKKNNENDVLFTYTFHFKRVSISLILLLYLPSILIVVLSWISFWLDVSAAAPRVALGLTSLLTLATQFNSAQKDLPAMATVKALDIWMFSCMFMVFGSLIEFAVAYRQYQLKSKEISNVIAYQGKPKQLKDLTRFCRQMKRAICKRNGNTIDDISKMLFPICFLIFNVTYWSYYVG